MKGVILTQTGQPLATPTPTELAKLFVDSPKVGLDFAKIFDFDAEAEDEESDSVEEVLPPSPSARERPSSESSHGSNSTREPSPVSSVPPTRLCKPSIRSSASSRPLLYKAATLPASSSELSEFTSSSTRAGAITKSTEHGATISKKAPTMPPVQYDLSNEENLPSPFLKRVERERAGTSTGTVRSKRPSTGNLLRVAAANAAAARPGSVGKGSIKVVPSSTARPSVTSTRKASEEARKALSRS